MTCAHCSRDMTTLRPHDRCSNDGLCESIEDFELHKNQAVRAAAQEIVRIAYAGGRGGIVEFRPHEFDDLKNALEAIK